MGSKLKISKSDIEAFAESGREHGFEGVTNLERLHAIAKLVEEAFRQQILENNKESLNS